VHTIRTAPGSFLYLSTNKLNKKMAGNPKTKKSVPMKGAEKAMAKGVKVGMNPKATTSSTAVIKKGGMKSKKY